MAKVFAMQQVEKFNKGMFGASADDLVNGFTLAEEAWGEQSKEPNSGLIAMAYLYRRFGPTWSGGDDYKSLVDYTLTTRDPDVFLWLHLSASEIRLNVGYMANKSIRKPCEDACRRWENKLFQWWFKQHPEFKDLEETKENQQTVSDQYWIWRDSDGDELTAKIKTEMPPHPRRKYPMAKDWRTGPADMRRVNRALLGAMKELLRPVYVRDVAINLFGRCKDSGKPAQVSEFAGYGIPVAAMKRHIRPTKKAEAGR